MALPWDAPHKLINWSEEAEKYYRMAFDRDAQEASTALALRRAEVAAQIGLLGALREMIFASRERNESWRS